MSARPIHTLTRLDTEALRFIDRFHMVRAFHVVAWTGASPWTVRDRLGNLARAGLVRPRTVSVDLRDGTTIRESLAGVWQVTGRGADRAGTWIVPGTGGVTVSMPARRPSALITHHVLGVADLAVWYRRFGYAVAAEREILSLERATALAPERLMLSSWTVPVPGRMGVHPPDMGVVHPDGSRWAIELERATKTVTDYAEVMAAYRDASLGQVWHVLRGPTVRRLREAAERIGVAWGPEPARGVIASNDGLIRLQGWLPGRVALRNPATWARQVPRRALPGGIAVPFDVPDGLPDLAAAWRRGVPIDVNAEDFDPYAAGRTA
ncbi:hypothetical protein [Cellulomonas hominis]